MIIFINQIREKIGVMFGNPETTTGGNALKFYSSVRLDIRRIGAIKDGDEVVGNQTRVKVVKNKMAPPFRDGRSSTSCTARASPRWASCSTSASRRASSRSPARGSRYGQRIGQGRENAKQFLREHPERGDDIEAKIRQNAGLVSRTLLDRQPAGSARRDTDERRPSRRRRAVAGRPPSWRVGRV